MTDDLIAFLAARLDDLELAAKIASVDDAWGELRRTIPAGPGTLSRNHRLMHEVNPARVLREVEAKREILRRHGPASADSMNCLWCSEDYRPYPWPCPDVLSIAAVWSDLPVAREEWKP